MASGDDVVLFCEPQLTEGIKHSIMQLTSRSKVNPVAVGLGQCMKTLDVGPFYDITFCSKWFTSLDGSLDGLTYTRDMQKFLCTK
jgi:hypothetical protein